MKFFTQKLHSGFTLIELLVVMGVLGTLAAGLVMVINPSGQLGKARDAKRKSDLAQIQRALEVYYDDYNEYPASLLDLKTASASYMEKVPEDPRSPFKYYYRRSVSLGDQGYQLYSHLESPADPQRCPGATADMSTKCSNTNNNDCAVSGVGQCRYGVSSPNTSP
ncbi:MAG TPA: prepilin-type N-terminal cleavage/methylation domain-containing protein [Candidatus Levybacteria bacterium]|nr:prepilin-type N-terminal cleavage/methylation domain-containing protein [Candidatus Levybacteria bacterium]